MGINRQPSLTWADHDFLAITTGSLRKDMVWKSKWSTTLSSSNALCCFLALGLWNVGLAECTLSLLSL